MSEETAEGTAPNVEIEVRENGPVVVSGPVSFNDGTGAQEAKRLFLCRCGNSNKLPMCDGSHKSSGFTAPGCDPTANS